MTYSLGRYLDVDWVPVSPTYDVKVGEYFFTKSLKDVDEATLNQEMFNLGISTIAEYEMRSAEKIWDSIKEKGDEPIYVSVSAYPIAYEPVVVYRLEIEVQARKLVPDTPLILWAKAIAMLLAAAGFFALSVAYAAIVFTAIFRGEAPKLPTIIPKEVLWAVIALASAGTAYYVYRIVRKK